MIKYLKLTSVALIAFAGFPFSSCSDDDSPENPTAPIKRPTIENVFSYGLPTSVAGATFITNDNGQVTKIANGDSDITFEYGSFTLARNKNFTVLMKIREAKYPNDGSDIYMQINAQGFVEYAYQIYLNEEDGEEEWWFEYNSDGQLSGMQRTEGGDDFNILYTDGNISKVVQDEESGSHQEYTILYTNDENKSAVPNKGCIMLFEDFFYIDVDEMGSAYFAGLLGKATKHLPMGYTVTYVNSDISLYESGIYHWVFNDSDLPVKFWEDDYVDSAIYFSWM